MVDSGPRELTMKKRLLIAFLTQLTSIVMFGQQLPDSSYKPTVTRATYPPNAGPTILVDEAHNNAQKLDERLAAFGKLVTADGFVVRANREQINASLLKGASVLMISNAAAPESRAASPSAFTDQEITAIQDWVTAGGSLLLIADHMPAPAAAARLAQAFGVQFMNGFTLPKYMTELPRDKAVQASYDDPYAFTRAANTLRAHIITNGRNPSERIAQIATFTGQGFKGEGVEPLLVFPGGFVSIFPETPWNFRPDSRRVDGSGWLQGAVKVVGKGRTAFFGEAAMFTAQIYGPTRIPMGINHPLAKENPQFILNLLHWLVGQLK